MAQIEPITVMVGSEEKKGEYLYAYKPFSFTETKIMVVEILDKDGYSLFSSNLVAETIEEVAEKLSLTLKTAIVDNTKELLTEIMEADAKDGLYEQEQRRYSEAEVYDIIIKLFENHASDRTDKAIEDFEENFIKQ